MMMKDDIPGFMSEDAVVIFQVIDMRTGIEREITAGLPSKTWWGDCYKVWSVGGISSGAQLEIDEDLNGIDLVICPAISNHRYIRARFEPGRILPTIARDHSYIGAPLHGGDRWVVDDNSLKDGEFSLRVDRCPFRIGSHRITVNVNSILYARLAEEEKKLEDARKLGGDHGNNAEQ